jgi:hypothetical protein
MMEDFMISQKEVVFKQNKKIDEFSDSLRAVNNRLDLVQTQNRLLETQMAQQAASATRPEGMLPEKLEQNPREHIYAVTLRSGKQYDGPKIPAEEEPKQPVATPPTTETEVSAASPAACTDSSAATPAAFPEIPAACTDFPAACTDFPAAFPEIPAACTDFPMAAPEFPDRQKLGNTDPKKVKSSEKYVPPLRFVPFPQRLVKPKMDQQFARFMDHLKKMNITIPFTEIITQMPSYAKFLKELLSNKRKLEEVETVALNVECSALILNKQIKLPPKLKDPGSFTIPCKIRDTNFNRCLLDLGASVCLMPKLVYDRLGLGELKQTRMSLQLVDRSVRDPSGIAEDVVVQIGKFYIPVDFVVVEMEEDPHTPLLFGQVQLLMSHVE